MYRCVACKSILNSNMQCSNCGKVYFPDCNNVTSMIDKIDSKKQKVEELYNTLGIKKRKNNFSRFSTFLNYGVQDEANMYGGGQKASLLLIKNICEKVNFLHKKVIDIGCGRGGNLFYIKHCFDTDYLVGLDLSYENITFCQSKNEDINFVRADAENIPYISQYFDIVLNIESALHYPNIEQFFKEVNRILVLDGIFIYVDIIDYKSLAARKRLLGELNFQLLDEYDYTEKVLNSMISKGMQNFEESKMIFQHVKIFKEMENKEKKYLMFILKKSANKKLSRK